MPPPLASGDLKSHPELSGWRTLCMSVMRVIVLLPCTKFEVRRPSHYEDVAVFRAVASHGVKLPGDLDL